MITLQTVLKNLPNNFIPISNTGQFRSHAVKRILSCHPESAWLVEWSNSFDSTCVSPLDWPECVDSFGRDLELFTEEGYFCLYDKVHGGLGLHDLSKRNLRKLAITKQQFKDKFVFLDMHPKTEDASFFSINPNTVVCWASNVRSLAKRMYYSDVLDEPSNPVNGCFNIDISRLFSSSFDEFLEEYLHCVHHFDFTPRINAVRSFILRYLEREDWIYNYLLRNPRKSAKL